MKSYVTSSDIWMRELSDPSFCRINKPRNIGLTMVIDKGMGLAAFHDLLQTSAPFIDYIKLGFGTAALYPLSIISEKIKLAKEYNIRLYPGGTFFELAYAHGMYKNYLKKLAELGFASIEISNGTIDFGAEERRNAIQTAINCGFSVITEYGKKLGGAKIELNDLMDTLMSDIDAGAEYVIVEGRESGKNVGIYDKNGAADLELLEKIKLSLKEKQYYLMWEAPEKSQQVELIHFFGNNVNLGNIKPEEIMATEALRRGLRSDTFMMVDKNAGRDVT